MSHWLRMAVTVADVLTALRAAAVLEAVTYALVVAAVVDRQLLSGADRVPAIGAVHGVVFLGYGALVLAAARRCRWSAPEVATLLASAFVPGGTIVAERRQRDPSPP